MSADVYKFQGRSGPGPRPPLDPWDVFCPADLWINSKAPGRQWMVAGVAPWNAVTLLSGDGGLGKSLLMQQLMTAVSIGRPWLGFDVQHCKVMGIFCEDEPDELWRRQEDICQFYDVDMADLDQVHMVSRVGKETVLAEFDRRTDTIKPTICWQQLRKTVIDYGIQLLMIDPVADTFGGIEFNRTHVRRFIGMLRSLTLEMAGGNGGAIVLTSHPSVQGMQSGSGISGSTAWRNSARAHLYLTKPKTPEGQEDDSDASRRVLRGMKSNYSAAGSEVHLLWDQGVFRVDGTMSGPATTQDQFEKLECRQRVVAAIRELAKGFSYCSPDIHSKTHPSKVLQKHFGACRKYSSKQISDAVTDLLGSGGLVIVKAKNAARKIQVFLRPPDMKLDGEVTEGGKDGEA